MRHHLHQARTVARQVRGILSPLTMPVQASAASRSAARDPFSTGASASIISLNQVLTAVAAAPSGAGIRRMSAPAAGPAIP